MIKTVQKKEEYFIQFTDEEMEQLKIKPNDKFTIEIAKDGKSFSLIPHEEIEIDLNEFSKEQLIDIIHAANEKNMTFEDFVVDSLEKFCESNKIEDEGSIL